MAELSQNPVNVLASATAAQLTRGTAGETITAGMPVYRDVADSNKLKKCKADAAGTVNCDGIALNGASDDQPLTYLRTGFNINLGATLAVGQTYCVSDLTAGKIVPIPDLGSADYVTLLGVALSTSILKLQILNSATAKA